RAICRRRDRKRDRAEHVLRIHTGRAENRITLHPLPAARQSRAGVFFRLRATARAGDHPLSPWCPFSRRHPTAVLGGPPTAPILGVSRLGATACRLPKRAGLLGVFIPHATHLRFPADLPDLIVL